MAAFLQKHRADVTRWLSGFDRLVLRGTLRQLCYVSGMLGFLHASKVLLKDFGAFETSDNVSTPYRPTTKTSYAAAALPSPVNFLCCAPMALSAKYPVAIATSSPPRAERL